MAYFPAKGSEAYSQILQALSQNDDLILVDRELVVFLVKSLLYYSEFDVDYYIEKHADLKEMSRNSDEFDPVSHFFKHGILEGREFGLRCDDEYYARQNPDVLPAFRDDPRSHFRNYGHDEGRAGTAAQANHVTRLKEL